MGYGGRGLQRAAYEILAIGSRSETRIHADAPPVARGQKQKSDCAVTHSAAP